MPIRLPANRILQERIGYLLKRPVGCPSNDVCRSHASFNLSSGESWTKPRRVIAKVEWHPGELYPRVGFIVTNMSRPAENVVAFYNKRGTVRAMDQGGQGSEPMSYWWRPFANVSSRSMALDLASKTMISRALFGSPF